MAVVPVLVGRDGKRYYTLAVAGARLGVSADTIRRELRVLDIDDLPLEVPKGQGRPPSRVVEAAAVERRREELLDRLGVDRSGHEVELKDLRRQHKALQADYEELAGHFELLQRSVEAQAAELETLRPLVAAQVDAVRRRIAGGSSP